MTMKRILAAVLFFATFGPAAVLASGPKVVLERAPVNLNDKLSLQRGAQIFVNHCLNCHGASLMRYGRLADLGLSEAQIRENLMFATDKIGDTMGTVLNPKDAKDWFGVVPPDLSLAARSRSPDWLYTYFKGFYRDPAARTGWNNTVFPNVSMPHVLWEYQGSQNLLVTTRMDPNTGDKKESRKLVVDKPGKLTPLQYDQYVGDLVNFLAYVAEPAQASRKQWGILVLFFLGAFFVVTLLLKNEYWKDVR
ncbi:Ammonia monooxygenase gamma subunit [Usitatibacter palustris]|uniref:Ammonia monooxygenase gamma subunit n=2 Tax=Usitatibacter palustris TaxID=2732487 RepID=A0A6M4HAZ2_9PROT|nr:Ammonia monooxygenase gamma subunit [Usitatibacter palustris]